MMRHLRYIVSGRAIITPSNIFRFYAHVYVFSSEYAVQVLKKVHFCGQILRFKASMRALDLLLLANIIIRNATGKNVKR